MQIRVPNAVSSRFGRQLLHLQKASPQVMFGAGVVGVVAATVLACRGTLKVDEILRDAEEHREVMDNFLADDTEKYTERDHKRDTALLKVRTARKLTTIYTPAVVVGVASIGLLTGSHVVLNRRNASLTAAYALVDKAFAEYRDRVRGELGEDKDREFRYGVEKVSETVEGKNGPKVTTVSRVKRGEPSQYARFFDQTCAPWSPQAEYNMAFLRAQQNYAQQLLLSRGHVFLNEIYDSLGIPRSKAGAVVGWVLGRGDDYVDFGIFDDRTNDRVRDFVNGHENSILLDFNVAGVIYDLIEDRG